MTEKEILVILKTEKERLTKIQKRLVEKRVKETNREKFNAKDIYKYSKYFKIQMNQFLLLILEIDESDYKKFLKGEITNIYSKTYNKLKEEYLNKKQKIFNKRVNWNMRTYFNKKNLETIASELNINTIDFALKILNKSKSSARRVLFANNLKTRLYIGRYVNTKLPKGYLEMHIDKIMIITKIAVKKATRRLRIRLNKTDYEDELQKCLIYINDNGNSLYKNNTPKIRNLKLKEINQKIFYLKMFYYELNELKNIKFDIKYIDNINYKYKKLNDEYSENELEELNLNSYEFIIAQDLLQGYTIEEISAKENINLSDCEKIKESIGNKIIHKTNWEYKSR